MARDNEEMRLPFYAWYPGDFRRDTQHLTRDERHAYRDIMDEIFVSHQDSLSLPDDDQYLARIVGRSIEEWKAMRYALLDGPHPMLHKRDSRIYQERLSEEIEKARAKSCGHSRGGQTASSKKATAKQQLSSSLVEASPQPSSGQAGEIKIKNQIKTREKESKSSSSSKPVLTIGAELLEALKLEGFVIPRNVADEWAKNNGVQETLKTFIDKRASVMTANSPIAYLDAILKAQRVIPMPRAVLKPREELQKRVDAWEYENLPPINPAMRADWNAQFEAHFGFSREAFWGATDWQIEQWLGALA